MIWIGGWGVGGGGRERVREKERNPTCITARRRQNGNLTFVGLPLKINQSTTFRNEYFVH